MSSHGTRVCHPDLSGSASTHFGKHHSCFSLSIWSMRTQYERTFPMYNFSADACGPAYITVGERSPYSGPVCRPYCNGHALHCGSDANPYLAAYAALTKHL